MLWSPVLFGAGCAVYFALKVEPPLALGAVLLAAALALALIARRVSRVRGRVIAANLLAFLAAGFFAAEARTAMVSAPVVWQRTSGQVEGWVVDVAGPGSGGGGRLLIAPYRIEGLRPDQLPALARVTVQPDALIGPGEAVRLTAILGPPPEPASPGAYDFARDSFFQRVGAVGFTLKGPLIVSGPRPPLGLRIRMAVNAARWALARRMIDDMGPETGGVAVAMTTGHEAWLNPNDVKDMRDAGLSHILSISGVHMAIVGGFVFLLLRLLIASIPPLSLRVNGKKLAAGLSLIAVGVYLVVSGAPPPAVRSAVTLAVAFTAVLFDRRAISLHALAVAALVVLTLQPEAVIQPGFQMSFAATAALVALAEVWPRPVRELSVPWPIRLVQSAGAWLMAGIAISTVAGAATSAFAIQHFNRVSLYGLPANLAMEPLSTFVIMPALALGAVMAAMGAPGAGAVLGFAGWGVARLEDLSALIAAWPKAVVTVASAPDIALPLAFFGLVFVCLWKGRLRWLGVPAALAVAIWPRPPAPAAWIASDGAAAAIRVGHRGGVPAPGRQGLRRRPLGAAAGPRRAGGRGGREHAALRVHPLAVRPGGAGRSRAPGRLVADGPAQGAGCGRALRRRGRGGVPKRRAGGAVRPCGGAVEGRLRARRLGGAVAGAGRVQAAVGPAAAGAQAVDQPSSPMGRGRGPRRRRGKVRGLFLAVLTPHPPTLLRRGFGGRAPPSPYGRRRLA